MHAEDDLNALKESFAKLCQTIAALRHPVTGCPWDLEQTHSSLRRYMIEEAYEAVDVMDPVHPIKLREELGDVLLQVVLNSQLAEDAGSFDIKSVVDGLDAKMRRRHPHVFDQHTGSEIGNKIDKSSMRIKWEEIKSKENVDESLQHQGIFSHLKPGRVSPASRHAVAIGKITASIAFDWSSAIDVFAQFESEVGELKYEIETNRSEKKIYSELGDVFFSLGQLCRHLKVDPEICAIDGNRKFLNRFSSLEALAKSEGLDIKTAGTEKLESLWREAKNLEQSSQEN